MLLFVRVTLFISIIISDLYFIDEPTDADVVPGGTIQFNCKAKHKNQFIDNNIKWYKDDEILLETSTRIQMLTKGTLIITNAQSEDIGLYRCEVEVQVCINSVNPSRNILKYSNLW